MKQKTMSAPSRLVTKPDPANAQQFITSMPIAYIDPFPELTGRIVAAGNPNPNPPDRTFACRHRGQPFTCEEFNQCRKQIPQEFPQYSFRLSPLYPTPEESSCAQPEANLVVPQPRYEGPPPPPATARPSPRPPSRPTRPRPPVPPTVPPPPPAPTPRPTGPLAGLQPAAGTPVVGARPRRRGFFFFGRPAAFLPRAGDYATGLYRVVALQLLRQDPNIVAALQTRLTPDELALGTRYLRTNMPAALGAPPGADVSNVSARMDVMLDDMAMWLRDLAQKQRALGPAAPADVDLPGVQFGAQAARRSTLIGVATGLGLLALFGVVALFLRARGRKPKGRPALERP